MRRIGTLSDETQARRFRNYLRTKSVDSVVRGDNDGVSWEVWVPAEDEVETARKEFIDFSESPDDQRFAVDEQADQIRLRYVDEQWSQRQQSPPSRSADPQATLQGEGNAKDVASPGREPAGADQLESSGPSSARRSSAASESSGVRSVPADPPNAGSAQEQPKAASSSEPFESPLSLLDSEARQSGFPVTIAIMILSVIASFATNMGEPRGSRIPGKITMEQQIFYGLSFVDRRDFAAEKDPFASLSKGEFWRVITPMFLHGNMFHLFFNMFFIFLLGSMIERIHGSLFFLILALVTQSAGMMVQVLLPDAPFMPEALRGSPFAIGASGVAYGLFGFMWIRPWLDKDYPIELDSTQFMIIIGGLIVCMTPIVPRVANGAHLGGLAAGMLIAAIGYVIRR